MEGPASERGWDEAPGPADDGVDRDGAVEVGAEDGSNWEDCENCDAGESKSKEDMVSKSVKENVLDKKARGCNGKRCL